MIPDASSFWWGHRDSWLPTLDPCSRAEGPVGCSTEGRRSPGLSLSKTAGQDVLSLAESQLMWIPRMPGGLDLLWHITSHIYINHIMTAASIQFYSRFVETFRNGDRDRFLRSKATWRRCHLGILPASSELWRRSKKARLGNWTPTLKADLVPQKCWSHLLSIKLDGFVSKIVFNSCFCLVTFLNCFLWESWPRCFFVSIFFEHRIQDDIPPSFSYCIDVILFITLSDYRYIHHNSIR